MFVRVELACVLSKEFFRPATALLVGSAALFLPVLTPTMQVWLNPAAALVVAFVFAAALATSLYSLTAFRVEARSFAAAPHRWLMPVRNGWAGAYAKPDRHGRMTLYSVWASPRNQHLGSMLMRQICAEMDSLGCDLHLVAVNGEVVSFYRHFGFEQVRHSRFAVRMFRPCSPLHPAHPPTHPAC